MGSTGDYRFNTQLPNNPDLPPFVFSSHTPNTVTPPESEASGVRDFGHEDVGRLSDVFDEEGERSHNAEIGEISDIKDVVLLDTTPSEMATTLAEQTVKICGNKVTPWNGEKSKSTPINALTFMKETMKEIFADISCARNYHELIVLKGMDHGQAVIHKSVITYYSEFIRTVLEEQPDSNIIYIANYSGKILQKVVEILYTGETFYSEQEKKDVNLIWQVMKALNITFSDKSFYYHPVECTIIKEEIEGEVTSQNQQHSVSTTILADPSEVDQTNECWYDDPSVNQKEAYAFSRTIRVPHPETPSKSVYVHSKCGEGRKIVRSMPALVHVNADEIREKEIRENRREAEILLSKHNPIVIDIDDEDDNRSSPAKKMRTTTYARGTSIIRDESSKRQVTSGRMNLNMVIGKTATLNMQQQNAESSHSHGQGIKNLTETFHQHNMSSTLSSHISTPVIASVLTVVNTDTVPPVTIPPNRPEGTGILFVQQSPANLNESPITDTGSATTSEMPKLQAASDRPVSPVVRKRVLRSRQKSTDITDLPKLDSIHDYNREEQHVRTNESKTSTSTDNNKELRAILTAAVIPGSKVNQFVMNIPNQHAPNAPISDVDKNKDMSVKPYAGGSGIGNVAGVRTKFRKLKSQSLADAVDVGEEILRQREAHSNPKQPQQRPENIIVVGSHKKPVPKDVKVDKFVEEVDDEDDVIDEDSIHHMGITLRSCPLALDSLNTSKDPLEASIPKPKGVAGTTERGVNRGRKGRAGLVTTTCNETTQRQQSKTQAGITGGGGSRRGFRHGRNGK